MSSTAELTLAAQLDQAGIPYQREFLFNEQRKWRADFIVANSELAIQRGNLVWPPVLIEIEGGIWNGGRHVRGKGFEEGCEKQAAAVIAGYRYVRASTRQVEEGECLEWIRQALGISTKEAA